VPVDRRTVERTVERRAAGGTFRKATFRALEDRNVAFLNLRGAAGVR
jgi:hypothetical protein